MGTFGRLGGDQDGAFSANGAETGLLRRPSFSSVKASLTIVAADFKRLPCRISAMLPHVFFHDGATYVVSFKRVDGEWHAALYCRDTASIKELTPIVGGELSGFSDEAIRAGYIGVAEWLVKGQALRQAVEQHLLEDAA